MVFGFEVAVCFRFFEVAFLFIPMNDLPGAIRNISHLADGSDVGARPYGACERFELPAFHGADEILRVGVNPMPETLSESFPLIRNVSMAITFPVKRHWSAASA